MERLDSLGDILLQFFLIEGLLFWHICLLQSVYVSLYDYLSGIVEFRLGERW